MQRRGVIVLLCALVVLSAVNTYLIRKYGNNAELYPMTAWQMFSGKPREWTEEYIFEVTPKPGAVPLEVHSRRLLVPKMSPGNARRAMTLIRAKVAQRKSQPWSLSNDVAQAWISAAQERTHSNEPPHSIRIVWVRQPLLFGTNKKSAHPIREEVFTLYPIRAPNQTTYKVVYP